jgi:hypothetical protein
VQPIMPPSWTTWTYWQYGTASVSGISGAADVSYLSASALQVLDPPGQSNVSGAVVNLQVGALTAKTVSYSATGLPPGLSINQTTGQISGTLQGRAASFPATVTVTPTSGSAVTQAFTWNVHGGVRMTAPSRTGTVGSPIIAQIAATDALPGCTLHLAATGLPPGLSMTGCGKIFGWPTKYGQFQVNVTASDSAGQVATASFGWRIYGARNAGPVGLVHLNSYRCLNSGTGSTVVGGTCTGSRAGKWTIVSDGTLRLAGKCLAATGSVVTLASCSSGAIHWQLGGGYGTLPSGLVNLTTGQCLNDPNSSQSGARVNTASCSHGTAQRWLLPAGQIASGVPGYCLSDYHRSGPVTQQVNVRKCAPSASQTWTVQPSGQVQIGTYCLSLAAGGAVAGRHAVLATCGSAAGQFWELYGGPEGVWLVNPGSGLCLADPGDRAKAGNGQALGSCQLSDPGVTWRVS